MKDSTFAQRLVIVIGGFVLIIFLVGQCKKTDSTKSNLEEKDLKAQIYYNGSQFEITNNDNFEYRDASLIVNDKYETTGINISPGGKYKVGAMVLTDDDGNRFGLSRKPLTALLKCKHNGTQLYYVGGWNK